MSEPTLFDVPTRRTDPETSRAAATAAAPGNAELVKRIRAYVAWMPRPVSAFEVAGFLVEQSGGRWDEGTVRTAVSRAGLTVFDEDGVSPRGRKCQRYTYEMES